ncbi:hypothetical protein MTO96_039458 [Rhipicephalus appendiculatus]
MHGVQYRTFIGDGDSSVYYQLQTKVDYGRFIKKNECTNHVVKCYTSRLYGIAKESKGTRLLLSAPRIKRMKNGARKPVSHYAKILRDFNGSTQDLKKEKARLIQELASDLRNGPLHVFGSHYGCKSYFCNGSKRDNLYDGLPKIQQVKLMSAANIIADKADRLITDDTSNLAEAIMSLVAKFSGGKQINRCQKGSYEHRCQGAGLQFQLVPEWHVKASKAVTCTSPAATLKKDSQKRLDMKRQTMSRKRRLFEECGHRELRYSNHVSSNSAPHYGPTCQKPDMSAAIFSANTERQLKDLQVDEGQQASIKEETRGQASSHEWHEQRRLRLTASNFHAVCTRKDSTPCDALVDIGQGLRIPLETWRRVQARDKDSLFIKDLLVTIWDPAQLQGRSLQACYKRRLEKQGFPESVVQTLMKRMNHYVGEKIADIDKMAKRMTSQLIQYIRQPRVRLVSRDKLYKHHHNQSASRVMSPINLFKCGY